MPSDFVQFNTRMPRDLKKRLHVELVRSDQKFTQWLRKQAETYLRQVEANAQAQRSNHERGH
jgi:hypothetical protein